MTLHFNAVTTLNLILSLTVLIVGCLASLKTKRKSPFFIGVAYGLFSISHLIRLIGLETNFDTTVMLIRIFGYLIVVAAVFKMMKE